VKKVEVRNYSLANPNRDKPEPKRTGTQMTRITPEVLKAKIRLFKSK